MNRNVNKNNRYLPKSIGVEIESCGPLMEKLGESLKHFFPTGNTESSKIYECQTVPVNTDEPLEVVLLGETVRRCIPNYVVGGGDPASASAHCHIVGLNYKLEIEHTEALMVGLMPFLSLSWNRKKFDEYTFRAGVVGQGSRYSRFMTEKLYGGELPYTGRSTWVRDQAERHRVPATEVRANENSPLWVYFITPILNNQGMVDKLVAMANSKESMSIYEQVKDGTTFDVYSDFIKDTKALIIPFLLEELGGILENFKEEEREFMERLLRAYLVEDEEDYDYLVNGLIAANKDITRFFNKIDKEVNRHKEKFNVIKEVA